MPNLTSNASIYRRGGFTFTGYISTPPLTVVLAGTLTAVPAYPALAVAYTLTSGNASDALPDLTVNFYSAAGVKKATLRVATGATVTSVSLPVAEFAQGVYDVTIGDTFQVVKTWNIWDRLVSATAALNKDSRITYTDQGSNPPPVCNSGGLYVGFDTTVSFFGSTSFTVDPDSGGTITHAWDFGDGTPSTSSSTNPASVVFPVGSRYVKHTATDASNGKSTIEYVWVRVHDRATDPPLAVQMDTLSSTVDQGWRCTFKLPVGSEGSINTLPDGALIVYWEDERYNGTQASYGSQISGRSHIKFVGYLVSDSIHIDPDKNEVTFEAVSPLAILEQTPALPQLMVNKSSPAKWSELKTLTTKKMFWYLAYWHSSLMDTFDFVWNDGVDLSYQRISVEGDTLAAQLRDIANSLGVQVTCDRLGRILFTRDPAYLSLTDRSSRTKTYDLTTADIMEVEITRAHRGTVKTVRGEGITPAGKALFANGPGNAPAPFGTTSDTLAKQIIPDLAGLKQRTELYFAKVNNLYKGQFVPKGGRITLPDGYDFFEPAYREFITLTLPATLNGRAIGWDDTTKWTVEAVNIAYDIEAGAKQVELTIDHETYGVGAVQYTPPPEASNGVISYPPLDVQFPTIPVDLAVDVDGNPVIPTGTTSGNECEAWSVDTAWLAENVLTLTSPPFGDNTALSGYTVTDFQWVNLGSPRAYMLLNNGTNSKFACSTDFPTAGTTWTITDVTGVYTKIRVGSTQGVVYVLSNQIADESVLVTFDGLNWTGYTVAFGTESSNRLNLVTHDYGFGDGTYCEVEIDLGAEFVVSNISLDYNFTNARPDLTAGHTFYLYDASHVSTGSGGGDIVGIADSTNRSRSMSVPNLTARYVVVIGAWLNNFGPPNSGWIDNVAVTASATTAAISTRFSTDYGATFATVETAGDAPGDYTGFDTGKRGTVVLVGTSGQVVKASAGGAYAAYGTTLVSGFLPSAIWIPDKQLTTSATANNATSPEYIVMSSVEDADGETMYRVTAGGNTFFAITPTISAVKGVAVSADCICMPYRSGKYIAVVADFGGTIKLAVSKDTGATWLDRGTVVAADYIRFRRGDLTLQQLYIASSGGALIVSQNLGIDLASRLSPGGAALVGVEPFG